MRSVSISDKLARYRIGVFLKWFFIIVALVGCHRLRHLQPHDTEAFDFANVFLGQRMLARGINPYEDSAIKSQWKEILNTYAMTSRFEPGAPDMPLLYPPWTLSMLLPFNFVPYPIAYRLWYVLIAVFLAAGIYFLSKSPERSATLRDFFWILAFLVAVNFTINVFLIGQPTFCAFLGLCGAYYFSTKKKPVAAGIFTFIASMKITLALPIIAFFLIKRNYRIIVTFVICVLAAMGVFIFFESSAVSCIQDYIRSLHRLRENMFILNRTSPYIGVLQSMTEPSAFLVLFLKGGVLKVVALLFPLLTAITLIIGLARKRLTDCEILVLLYLILFTATYVRCGDLSFFLALSFMYCCHLSEKALWVFCMIISPFFFPLNSALIRLHIDPLSPAYFSQPMVIAVLLLFFNWILLKKIFSLQLHLVEEGVP